MKKYDTKQGDTFDLIAYKIFGDHYLCGDIIDVNIDLAHYVIFPAGIQVNIPEIDIKEKEQELPPWKR